MHGYMLKEKSEERKLLVGLRKTGTCQKAYEGRGRVFVGSTGLADDRGMRVLIQTVLDRQ